MASFDRRNFLKKVLGAGAISGLAAGCGGEETASQQTADTTSSMRRASASGDFPWKYAMCNESLQDRSWAEQCRVISEAGYTGVEIAPFTMVENRGRQGVQDFTASERREMVRAMQDNDLECVGLHWLLAPPPEGLHFTTSDDQVRQRSVEYLGHLVDFCADLKGQYMIFGSPDQRSAVEGLSVQQATNNLADGLSQVADHAGERGVVILVEPLSSNQTGVVNTVGEAMQVVRKVDHPAVQTMFDFHNAVDETTPTDQVIEQHFDHINHIHVQEMDGRYLGAGNGVNDFVDEFRVLKDLGYDKWVSLEVFDFSPGGEKIAEDSMKTLKKIEAKIA